MRASNHAARRTLDALRIATIELRKEASALEDALATDAQRRYKLLVSFWQSRCATVVVSVVNQVASGLAAVAREDFLSTLRFTQVYDRYDAVPEAHRLTYRWALQQGARRDEQWDCLATWFESSPPASNIYWVTGQPGCGKSTLMKFLATSPLTKHLLTRWTRGRPMLTAQCYFWAPGTEIQKSPEGMLRSLLFQLLGDPGVGSDFIKNVCPAHWNSSLQNQSNSSAWSVSELKAVFLLVVERLTQKSFLMLFVDGLDEYGEDQAQRQELIDLFLSMKEISCLKICISSRPWNIFLDAFRELPSLILEQLNRPDIESYVMAKCSESVAFQDLSTIDPDRATAIRSTIVDKSSGVFLWVTLVTRRLLTDMQDGIGLLRAEKLLDDMPPGLDEYFKFMIDSIRPSDRCQAARIYQLMVWHNLSKPLTLVFLSFVVEQERSFARDQALKCESLAAMEIRVLGMQRFFASQSMDLLVYRPGSPHGTTPWKDSQVDFLHRTVADFLRTSVP